MSAIQQMLLAAGAPARTYATWNPADKSASVALSGGNLILTVASFGSGGIRATLSKSAGKWCWETVVTNTSGVRIGGANSSWPVSLALGNDTNSVSYVPQSGQVVNGGVVLGTLVSSVAGDVIGVGLDMTSNFLSFYKNGTPLAGGSFSIPAGTYFPAWSVSSASGAVSCTANFGATALAFPIAGFNAGLYV